ncbi:MAG: rRNA maturation RNase YbeY [Candidatus Marinimicrobia bacterium]|nr:rRNA maturation RNase YbeY [Candidatus Neomarinimicrobiota bacterium]
MSRALNVEGLEYVDVESDHLKSVMQSVLQGEKKEYDSVSVLFVSDSEIREINKDYLGHDYSTDVITFPLNDEPENLEGEIYVSYETTKNNSLNYNVPHSNEILRVVIHGILHLVGYDDSTDSQKEEMKKKEDHYIQLAEITGDMKPGNERK